MAPRRRETLQRPGGPHRAPRRRLVAAALLCFTLLPCAQRAHGFTVAIAPASPKTIYLQVGVGTFTGFYDAGGTPGNNTTVNKVTVSVAAAAVGNGTAQAMTTDSTAATSSYDGYAYCNVPSQLYIGGFYRTTSAGTGSVSVTATVPSALIDAAGDSLSFARISWTTGGNGPLGDSSSQPFPAGTFTPGAVQVVGAIAQNHWAESCWTFSYGNTTVPAAGTYTGRVLYTLSAP